MYSKRGFRIQRCSKSWTCWRNKPVEIHNCWLKNTLNFETTILQETSQKLDFWIYTLCGLWKQFSKRLESVFLLFEFTGKALHETHQNRDFVDPTLIDNLSEFSKKKTICGFNTFCGLICGWLRKYQTTLLFRLFHLSESSTKKRFVDSTLFVD